MNSINEKKVMLEDSVRRIIAGEFNIELLQFLAYYNHRKEVAKHIKSLPKESADYAYGLKTIENDNELICNILNIV